MMRNPRMLGMNPISESRPCWTLSPTFTAAMGMCCSSRDGGQKPRGRNARTAAVSRMLLRAAPTAVLATSPGPHVRCPGSVLVCGHLGALDEEDPGNRFNGARSRLYGHFRTTMTVSASYRDTLSRFVGCLAACRAELLVPSRDN